MVARSYEHLPHLLGAYFHQDWPLEAADWHAVVRLYRSDVAPEDAQASAEEIKRMLTEGETEAVLADRLLREFGCYYDPRPDRGGLTFREWLSQLATALCQKQSTADPGP